MTAQRYSGIAIFLHWAIALTLAMQIGLGWAMEELARGPAQFSAYQLHKSIGIAILVLSVLRLLLRYTRPRPAAFADSRWAAFLSKLVHGLFYAVMILGPISGWVIVSTSRIQVPTMLFGVVPLPHLPGVGALHEPAEAMHGALAWVAIGLLVLHVAGALRHQLLKQENVLARMIPMTPATRGGALIAAGIALAAILAAFAWGQVVVQEPPAIKAPLAAAASVKAEAVAAPPDAAEPDADVAEEEAATAETQPLAAWTVASGGRLGFTARWNGTPVNGSFSRWDSDIKFSPDDLAASRITVEVDLASVNTSDSQRDGMLQGSDFFNITAHPKAVFTSRSITSRGGDNYRATGTLDLHGVKQPVTLNFTLAITGDSAKASGSTRLDRTAFGVGSGDWAKTDQIAGDVDVAFALSATRR